MTNELPEEYLQKVRSWCYHSILDETFIEFQPIRVDKIPRVLEDFFDLITYNKERFGSDADTFLYFIKGTKVGHSKSLVDKLEEYYGKS